MTSPNCTFSRFYTIMIGKVWDDSHFLTAWFLNNNLDFFQGTHSKLYITVHYSIEVVPILLRILFNLKIYYSNKIYHNNFLNKSPEYREVSSVYWSQEIPISNSLFSTYITLKLTKIKPQWEERGGKELNFWPGYFFGQHCRNILIVGDLKSWVKTRETACNFFAITIAL